ncbi:MAG: hypothetical protein ABSD92_02520 [Candidatus Bathyarchaeia archaeon]
MKEAGLLKKENGNYVINKVILTDCIKVNRFLIRTRASVLLLITELTVLRPPLVTSFYFFATVGTFICALAFSYETAKVWSKGGF